MHVCVFVAPVEITNQTSISCSKWGSNNPHGHLLLSSRVNPSWIPNIFFPISLVQNGVKFEILHEKIDKYPIYQINSTLGSYRQLLLNFHQNEAGHGKVKNYEGFHRGYSIAKLTFYLMYIHKNFSVYMIFDEKKRIWTLFFLKIKLKIIMLWRHFVKDLFTMKRKLETWDLQRAVRS